jgi:hypothetical protein
MCSVNVHCSVPHFIKFRQTNLAKLLGAFFIFHCESVKYTLVNIRIMQVGYGKAHADSHDTTPVD